MVRTVMALGVAALLAPLAALAQTTTTQTTTTYENPEQFNPGPKPSVAVMGLVGRTADGAEVDLEMLMLPLAHTGHARIRGLGVLAPLSPPYWLGSKPVTELSLTALRHIGPEIDGFGAGLTLAPAQAPLLTETEPPASSEAGRRRHGFVVYSGGREVPPVKVG